MNRLFYCLPTAGDVLYLLIDPEKTPDKVEKKGRVVALYAEEKLIGINLLDFSKLVKIKASGMILNPPKPLLDVVKNELALAGLPPLELEGPSGFVVAQVAQKEEHPLDEKKSILTLNLGDKTLTTSTRYQNLEVGSLCVVLTDGGYRFNGTLFHSSLIRNIPQDCEVCSEADLHIGEESLAAYVPQSKKPGEDFFSLEEEK